MKKLKLTFILFLFVKLLYSQNPELWGMTYTGGTNGVGTIFRINGDGTGFTTVYSFIDSLGKNPSGSLLRANNGKLYGTTATGGFYNKGVLFSFDTANNTYSDLLDFNVSNGQNPFSSLIQISNGKLYGVTNWGGTSVYYGVIFSFDPNSNIYTKLYDFNNTDGANPRSGLMQATNGKLYGTSIWGGVNNYGVIFSFDSNNNTYTKLFDFDNVSGSNPWAGLIQATNGDLYGTTYYGGANNYGVIFSFNINNNAYSDLFEFNGSNGQIPRSHLTEANNGNLYGVTSAGGANGFGTLFSISPNNNLFTNLHDFNNTDGNYAFGNLIQASNNKLYGMTGNGGSSYKGVIYSFDISNNTLTKLLDFNGSNGESPIGGLIEMTSTGISEPSIENQINVFSNLTSDFIIVTINLEKENKIADFKLQNLLGQTVLNMQEQIPNRSYTKKIDVGKFSNGIYFFEIIIDGERTVKKIVKK